MGHLQMRTVQENEQMYADLSNEDRLADSSRHEDPSNVEVRNIHDEVQEVGAEMFSAWFTLKQAVKHYYLRNGITEKNHCVEIYLGI